jgi:hypothetical protein
VESELFVYFSNSLSLLVAFLVAGETGYLAEKTGGGWWKVALDSGSSTKHEVEVSLIKILHKSAI